MAFLKRIQLENTADEAIDPATSEGLTLLRRIFYLLKPLGQITGSGSNRLSVDINNVVGGTIGTVSTVSALTNIANVGGVSAFEQMKATSRMAYNTGVRANIT